MVPHSQKSMKYLFLIMRLTFLLLFVITLSASATVLSQTVSFSARNIAIEKAFKEIKKQTGFVFFYDESTIRKDDKVNLILTNASIDEALKACLSNTSLTYAIIEGTIVIKQKVPDQKPLSTSVSEMSNVVSIDVKGRIINERGEPVEGVSVIVKGTSKGVVSNAKGEFLITAIDETAVLVLTSVNIESLEIRVNRRTDLSNIKVKTKIVSGSDAIVVSTGYQTISKERVTGSTDRVDEAILSKRPYANLSSMLVGQVAGLVADPATGFTIRGRASFSAAGDRIPLLVVDGFPIEGGFSSINPNDVKTVDVLKDAAATSIYGARAANGVIVVTTKGTGAKGKMNVSYNNIISVGEKIDLDYYMNMADSKSHIDYIDKIYTLFKGTTNIADPYNLNAGTFRSPRSDYANLLIERQKGYITQEYFDIQKDKMLNTNYKDDLDKYMLRNYLFQQHSFSIAGTGEKNSYKFSALLDNDKSSYQFNDNTKLLLNFTNIYTFNPNIKYQISGNITTYNSENNGINLSHAKSIMQPWSKLIGEDGNYTRMSYQNYEPLVQQFEPRLPYNMRYNLLEESSLKDNTYKGMDMRLQNQIEFKLADGLKFTPMFQYESFNDRSISIYDEKMYATRNYANLLAKYDTAAGLYFSQLPQGGIYKKNSQTFRQSIKLRAQLDFNRTFKDKHEIVALAGGEVISTTTEVEAPEMRFGYNPTGLNYALFDYSLSRLDIFGNTVLENTHNYEGDLLYNYMATGFRQSYKYNDRFVAGYFNGSYTYDRRFTVSVSARTDASNYVSKTLRDKFSPFYSAGLLWNLKNEKFMQKISFIDRLAVRGSYGVTGLAAGKTSVKAVTVFSSLAPYAETGNFPAGIVSGRDNDFLTWEKTYSSNLGLDFRMFKGKLSGSIDMYHRYSKDVLSSVQTSQVIQSTQTLSLNMGEILNKGIELSLGTNLNISKNLVWNGSLNFDFNYNEVKRFDYLNPTLGNYLGTGRGGYVVGRPTDYLYMLKIVGTTKDGYFVQEKKNGELVVANSTANSFSNFGRATIPGITMDLDDRVYYMGRTTAPATLGFTNRFSYKGFSFMSVILGRFGHVFSRRDEQLNYAFTAINFSKTGLASLQSPSIVATNKLGNVAPGIINQAMLGESSSIRNFYSNQVVNDASFLRLNELYLGYDLSDAAVKRMGGLFKSINLFTQLRNLGTIWTGNDLGFDPENPIGTLKPIKVFTFGAKVNL
jgi:TonB-linked SusC/RagA family outer membrane protein